MFLSLNKFLSLTSPPTILNRVKKKKSRKIQSPEKIRIFSEIDVLEYVSNTGTDRDQMPRLQTAAQNAMFASVFFCVIKLEIL